MAQPAKNARTDAASTATRAMFCVSESEIAIGTMNSAIVKPMPESAAPPAMRLQTQPRRELSLAERAHEQRWRR